MLLSLPAEHNGTAAAGDNMCQAAAAQWSSAMHPYCCRREQTGALCDSVSGGTAWAVLMAGGLGKPVYVFDDEVRGDIEVILR